MGKFIVFSSPESGSSLGRHSLIMPSYSMQDLWRRDAAFKSVWSILGICQERRAACGVMMPSDDSLLKPASTLSSARFIDTS